jgi:hypothetical protein
MPPCRCSLSRDQIREKCGFSEKSEILTEALKSLAIGHWSLLPNIAASVLPGLLPLTRQSAAGIVLATTGFPLGYRRSVLGSVIASVVRADR